MTYLDFEPDFDSPSVLVPYDELPLWSAMFGLLLLDEVPLHGVTNALDIGCGTGFPLIELAERLGPASHVHGVDPWQGGLRRASEKIAARRTPNVTLHHGSAASMPFPDSHFDLAVSNLGLNNFEDRVGAIRECRRVMRAGATIALTTNLQGHMAELYEVFGEILTNDTESLERLREHVAHRATIDSVRELIEENGFTVTRVVEKNGLMRFANGTALFHHHFIKLGFLDAWKKIVAPADLHETFARLEVRLNELAQRKGELRLTIPMAYIEGMAQSSQHG